jgi:hypothetical protein
MERAAVMGFDFLLAPPTLAVPYALADLAVCTMSDLSCATSSLSPSDNDESRRDLIWLHRRQLTATSGVIVSMSEDVLELDRVSTLRDLIAAARVAGHGDRCVLLEIEIGSARTAQAVAGEEDDALENFIISLGKTLPKNGADSLCAMAMLEASPEALYQFFLMLKEIGCDGVSLVLSDPLNDLEFFGCNVLNWALPGSETTQKKNGLG